MTNRENISNVPYHFAGLTYFACEFKNKDAEINVRDAVNSKIKPVQKALTLTWDGAARGGRPGPGARDGARPGTRHGSGDTAVVARAPGGGGQCPPPTRRRAATAGWAAGAATAPRRGRRWRRISSGGDGGPL